MNNKYEYFLCITEKGAWGTGRDSCICSFVACDEKVGFVFNKDGSPLQKTGNSGWRLESSQNNWLNARIPLIKASTLEECLSTINKAKYPKEYNEIFKILGIRPPDYKPIVITDKIKEEVLNNLRKNRAFNGDSAWKVSGTEQELYGQLAEEKIIRTLDYQKYWIEV